MNANLYRIVFNKSRGLLMAVAETASGQGKGQGKGQGDSPAGGQGEPTMGVARAFANMAYTAAAAAFAFAIIAMCTSADAQIIADPSAPGTQRAIVLSAPNGVPLVNIQTPSAAGVSRNVYSQFDVLRNGAILNNSRSNVQTQLGGWAQGNPWLATGAAKVILNEVNSANPSLLKGYVEVAGQKADVIIANPAGIKVDGAGFINAGNVVLTTGAPVLSAAGNLDGFRVQRGTVVIEGLGLDTRTAAFTDIIARAVQVNAGLWANYLRITGGAGDVSAADPSRITPLDGSVASAGDKPQFMLDVAALGGMYAGHIYLVGSEAGLGVNNNGVMAASGAGTGSELVLLANGQLVNRGSLQATGELQINAAGGISNSNGQIAAGSSMTLNAGQLTNTQGSITAGGALSATTTQALNNSAGLMAANGNVSLNAASLINSAGTIASVQGGLTVNTSGTLNNDSGYIGAKDALTANTGNAIVSNTRAGQIVGQSAVTLTSTGFDNRSGQVQALGDLSINAAAGTLNNAAGLLRSAGTTGLNATSVINSTTSGANQGIEGKDIAITVTGSAAAAALLANDGGAIRADRNATLTSSGLINNTGGLISAGNTLTLRDGAATTVTPATLAISNASGVAIAGKAAGITAASASGGGQLLSQGTLDIDLSTDYNNTGEVTANGNLRISTTGQLTNSGKLQSGATLSVSGRDIDNTATGEITGAVTQVRASNALTNRGLIDGQDTQIDAGTLNNIGTGRIYGDTLSIAANVLNNSAETLAGLTTAGTIAARVRLDIGAQQINNQGHAMIFSGGDMTLAGALDGQRHATGSAQAITNDSASIEALGQISITTQSLLNNNTKYASTDQTTGAQHVIQHAEAGGQRLDASQVRLCDSNGCVAGDDIAWLGRHDSRQLLLPSADFPFVPFAAFYASFPKPSSDVLDPTCLDSDANPICSRIIAGQYYPATDPIWAAFGVVPQTAARPDVAPDNPCAMLGAACTVGATGYNVNAGDNSSFVFFPQPVTQAQWNEWQPLLAWTQAYNAAHAALDARLAQFNASIAPRMRQNWDYWDYTQSVTTPVLTASDPAHLISGGAMTLSGQVTNNMSEIIAGGSQTVNGPPVSNISAMGESRTVQSGVTVHTYKTSCAVCADDDRAQDALPYNLDLRSPVPLALAVMQSGTGQTPPTTAPGAAQLAAVTTGTIPAGTVAANLRVAPIVQVSAAVAAATGANFIRTTQPNIGGSLNSSLFHVATSPTSSYLVETDPRFASYSTWLTSDYMLTALGINPTSIEKRLGDGFIEQRLVREQVSSLTGLRFLANYTSDDEEYRALMNAGVTYAKQWNLRPGIALTDVQMAQLTSDIVWLVEQDVTLPNGSTAKALVPQVYARVKDGDLATGGALLSGASVNMKLSGDLVNSGVILGRDVVSITAQNVQNLAGRISGNAVDVTARDDLNNIGGQISAASKLAVTAGRDLNVQSTTRTGESSSSTSKSSTSASSTTLDRIAGLYVTGDNATLVASAGRDATFTAALISNSGKNGTTDIHAVNDLKLDAITVHADSSANWDANNNRVETSRAQIGSVVQGAGSVTLTAGNNITGTGATLQAGGALVINAVKDVNLSATATRQTLDEAHRYVDKKLFTTTTTTTQDHYTQTSGSGALISGQSVSITAGQDLIAPGAQITAQDKLQLDAGRNLQLGGVLTTTDETHSRQTDKKASGLGQVLGVASMAAGAVLPGAALLTKSQGQQTIEQHSKQSQGATLSGGSISTHSGGDTTAPGIVVVADGDISMLAGGNMDLNPLKDTSNGTSQSSSKKSGFIGTLLQPAIGTVKQSQDNTSDSTTQAPSTIASLGGNITIQAGGAVTAQSAQIMALSQAPGTGNVDIQGKTVDLSAASNTQTTSQTNKTSKTAIGASISVPLLDAARTVANVAEAATQVSDARMAALGAATVALQAKGVSDAAKALANGDLGGVKISISLGHSTSESNSTHTLTTAVGSLLTGNNVSVKATGAGLDSNIDLTGATVTARDTATLAADGKVTLKAATNTVEQHNTNSSSGWNLGVGFAVGAKQNGLTLDMGANKGQGNTDGTDVTQVNAHVTAGKTATINSGGDTDIRGAVVTAPTVTGKIDGNLLVESVQDTSTYTNKQSNTGFGVSLCVPPMCYGDPGLQSANVSGGKTNTTSTYASTAEQSGIRAGDGGFQVDVKGSVTLKGGAITSTQKAVDDGKNRLVHGGELILSDILNSANYDAKGYSVSAGVGSGYDKSGQANPSGSFGAGQASGSAGNVTKAGISGIAGNKDARTGDAQTGIAPIFDAAKVNKDVQAQITITTAFKQNAAKAIGDYAQSQLGQAQMLRQWAEQETDPAASDALKQQAQILEAQWGSSGALRVAAHVIVGGLTGGLDGAMGAAAGTLTGPAFADALSKAGVTGALAQTLTALAATGAGAVAGGATGAGTAFNEVTNNFLKHDQAAAMKREIDACRAKSGGCADADVISIANRYRNLSNQNIATVQACIVAGNTQCVSSLQSQAATVAEVEGALPFGYGALAAQFAVRQDNVVTYGSVKGKDSLFGTDIQQAAEVAQFRQANCNGISSSACDGLVTQALNYRLARVGILAAVGALTPVLANGVRSLVVPAKGAASPVKLTAEETANIQKARLENNIYASDGRTDPAKPMSPGFGGKTALEISPQDATKMVYARLPAGAQVVSIESADALNAAVVADNPRFKAPYIPGTEAVTVTNSQSSNFVRVYTDTQQSAQVGTWMFKAEDIAGLTPQQIASKYSLPQVPNMMTDVTVPAGQTIRVTMANDVQIRSGIGGNGGGGGVQFEVLSAPKGPSFGNWFSNPRPLK